MVDVPAVPPTPPVAPAPVQPAAPVAPVPVTLTDIPDKIQQLIRQIQVTATVTEPPAADTITVNSVIGNLTLLLPQMAKDAEAKMTQQLLSLIQTQKPLTVVVQPGNPPTQAFLVMPPPLPTAGNAQQNANAVTNNIILQAVNQPQQPATVGLTLPAIVLPPDTPVGLNNNPPPPSSVVPAGTFIPGLPEELPQALAQTLSPVLPQANPASVLQGNIAQGAIPAANLPPIATPQIPLPPLAANLPPISTLFTPPLAVATQTQIAATPPSNIGFTPNQFPAAPSQVSVNAPTTTPTTNTPQPAQTYTPPVPGNSQPYTYAPATTNTPQNPAAALLQPGNAVNLHIDAILPPNTPTASLPLPGANQVLATVTGNAPNGQLILKAGDATLFVTQSTSVPAGSTLLLNVEPARTTLPPLVLQEPLSFSALQQGISTLAQMNPQLAQQVLNNLIPQPNQALPAALLFFMSAAKQGSVRGWLGDDAVDALTRAGKFELIGKIARDFGGTAADTTSDPVVGEWRSYPIPLYNNQQFQMLNLYVHNSQDREGGRNQIGKVGPEHVRFIIDMRMSMLGSMQLDGFVQPRKLDMIVRSEHALPAGLHNELRQAYINAIGAVDYTGSLNFQVGRQHWLNIQKAAAGGAMVT